MRPAPLQASDARRARRLKRMIADRLTDMPRHYRALEAAIAEFGEDFDRDVFEAAFAASDPARLNTVRAVERGLDLLHNYLAELAALGLELAELRDRDEEPNAPRDARRLAGAGVIASECAERLNRLARLRARMVHDYPDTEARDVHEAVTILRAELPRFERSYIAWVKAGFPAERTR